MIETWGFYIFTALPAGAPIDQPITPEDYQRAFNDYFDLWSKCDDLGFDGLSFAEHHGQPVIACPSPNLIIAALAKTTSRIRFTTLGSVLSMHHGWRYAEECGMLDYLTGGRFEPGIAPGAGPSEAVAVGIPASETRARYYSAAEVLLKAMQGSSVTHHDDFHNLDERNFVPPMRTGLSAWATVMSPDSAKWAGQRGVKICTAWMPTSTAADLAAVYRDAASDAGKPTGAEMLGIRRRVWVADSDAEAQEQYESVLDPLKSGGGIFETADETIKKMATHPDDYIIGSPATVAERLIEQCKAGGYGAVMMFPDFAGFTMEQQHRAHQLIGQKVAPMLRSADPGMGTSTARRPMERVHSGRPAVVEGSYQVTMRTPMGPQDGALELLVSDVGALSGTVTTMIGSVEFDGGALDGPRVRWEADVESPMGSVTMKGNAIVDGDEVWGSIELGPGLPKLTFEGTRN